MDPTGFLLKILVVLVLVGVNAYFVAAEFALVAVRRTRIEQRVRHGDVRARHVAAALDHPDDFISAAQLGITLASIGIGYVAEDTIHAVLLPFIQLLPLSWLTGLPFSLNITAHGISITLTLLLVTFLHVVLGEQVPKMISLQRAEPVALLTAPPTQYIAALLRPLIRVMSGSANALIRAVGLEPRGAHTLAHTPEEIRILVEQSQQEGMVEEAEEQMIHGVFEFRERLAREVMTPRPDIIALPVEATLADVVALIAHEAPSRIPVFQGSLDEMVGMLLVKDLLPVLAAGDPAAFDLRRIMREPCFVPDTKRIGELLAEFRARNIHMAIVIDEFGGTEGLVTLEDLLEEIVGDIYDEHDRPEPGFTLTAEGDVLIDGGASIAQVNERYALHLPERDFDTIGGFIFGELGRIPAPGDQVSLNGSGELRVEATQERRVIRVRLVRPPEERLQPHGAPTPDSSGAE